ncbi:sulfopyruvate decarboxylase subunit beta [Methanothermobacter sp.]|uniref:sulfopyruvate decarboxylase subunit beta n=1 Tax=Methanothermobacter sp. TaxID=1884223 RepID=UPI00261FA05E|nr:sulfopyruvate decarboxylase subunit beta [Methanothermobacter sp.]MDI9618514.1 sulfopyruvate decarboxylase subunit beta [Methanothermobacter sp.]
MLTRIEAIERIVEVLDDELVVCNLGFPSRELYSIKDSSRHFYMLGSMGMASSIGLGLALSQKRRIVVLDGDGSILMNLGGLVTAAAQAPKNLFIVLLDNRCYGSTGSQCTYSDHIDLGDVAGSMGFNVIRLQEEPDFKRVLEEDGPVFAHVPVKPGNADVPVIDLSPEEIIERFMDEVRS